MDLNVTFLSPIEVRLGRIAFYSFTDGVFDGPKPGDWTLQSLPFAYMYFEAWSTDGNEHSVQVYSDLTAGALMLPIPLSIPVPNLGEFLRVALGRLNRNRELEHVHEHKLRLS